jgi:hypothetical protein
LAALGAAEYLHQLVTLELVFVHHLVNKLGNAGQISRTHARHGEQEQQCKE